MDVEPDTINKSGKVGVNSGLEARMIAVIALLVIRFLVCVLFAGLRFSPRVILTILSDGAPKRALLKA